MAAFALDDTTIVLLLVLLAVLLYLRVFSSVTPLVHPLLLGKQSEVAQTRDRGQSAVYRSWATGLGTPLTVRPANSLKTVCDIVSTAVKARCVLEHNLSNESLETLAKTLSYALPQLFPTLSSNSKSPILSILPSLHSLPVLLLALSRRSSANPLILLDSPEQFTKALIPPPNSPHSAPGLIVASLEQLEDVVEQVIDDDNTAQVGILVIGAPTDVLPSGAIASGVVKLAEKEGVTVKFWEDVWEFEDQALAQEKVNTAQPNDIHSFIYDDNGRTLTVTHENITAGIAGIFSMFPADKRPTAQDVIVSSVPLTEAFGLSLALGCIWAGAGFRILDSTSLSSVVSSDPEDNKPAPSMILLSKTQLLGLTSALDATYRRSPLYTIAARHKALGISQGVVSRKGLFESLVWRQARNTTFNGLAGSKLRACVVVNGSLSQKELASVHLSLSLPLTRLFKSSVSAGPITASHFYDLQCEELAVDRGTSSDKKGEFELAHVGAPASNVELRLRFPNGVEPEEDEPIGGAVEVRGPAVLSSPGEWTSTGRNAIVRTNGTFVLA